MRADTIRHQFASDNTAAICPEAWKALEQANADYAPSYGEDEWTAAVCERIRQLFEVDCDVYFVFTGTGANALGLAQVCQPFHGVICHERAHIQTDEAGAMEFYTRGAKLFLTKTPDAKIDLGEARNLIAQQVELHGHMMQAISIAQATELGTVTRRMKLRRSAPLRRRTKCCFIWTVRALRTPSHPSDARRKRSLGKRAWMYSALAERKMASARASWSFFSTRQLRVISNIE